MRSRTLVVVGVVVALLVAGVGSFYASSNPDGLEYVAEQAGFLDTAEENSTADGPLAGYQTRGVEDDRLSGGLAGVLGALVVLLLVGGLTWAVRRRGSPTRADGHDEADRADRADRSDGPDRESV